MFKGAVRVPVQKVLKTKVFCRRNNQPYKGMYTGIRPTLVVFTIFFIFFIHKCKPYYAREKVHAGQEPAC